MPDDRESPSAGWREVYDEMEADTNVEEATHICPDCDRTCQNVIRDVYECEEHGVFRVSAGGESEQSDESGQSDESNQSDDPGQPDDPGQSDESDQSGNRATGRAD